MPNVSYNIRYDVGKNDYSEVGVVYVQKKCSATRMLGHFRTSSAASPSKKLQSIHILSSTYSVFHSRGIYLSRNLLDLVQLCEYFSSLSCKFYLCIRHYQTLIAFLELFSECVQLSMSFLFNGNILYKNTDYSFFHLSFRGCCEFNKIFL